MQRADHLLVQKGLARSRTQAQHMIKDGRVSMGVDQCSAEVISKPSQKFSEETQFWIEAADVDQYVSRGALKLKAAIEKIGLDVRGLNVLDVGQSTGGFTDFLIQSGAEKVVGVDVGHNQLDQRLKTHPNVYCYEGINARDLPAELLLPHTPNQQGFDLAVMDVSFISQIKIYPSLIPLIKPGGYLISLVKPQFELGKQAIGKGGIVVEKELYAALEDKIAALLERHGMKVISYFKSPIKGGDGNREFLTAAKKLSL